MKKASLITLVLIGSFYLAGAQTLQKGNILGIHEYTNIQLKEGVTMKEYVDTYMGQLFPAYQKALEGIEIYNLMGLRGECQNCTGFIMVIQSQEVRDKYWNESGNWTDYGLQKLAGLQPAMEALEKLGTYTTTHTDWLVDPSVDEFLAYKEAEEKE